MAFRNRLGKEFSFIKGNYAIIVLSWILIDFAGEIPATYYALYVLKLGATETILGIIGFAGFLALASMQFPGGYLADKFGRKWLVSSMTFGVALSFILYAFAPSWPFILIGVILTNFFNSIYQPALMAIVSDSLPSERRGMGFGLIMLITSTSTTPGPLVAVLLYNQFGLELGMRAAYGIVIALFLIAAIMRFRLRETFIDTPRPSWIEFFRSYPTSLRESVRVWKRVPRSMFYLFLSGAIMMFGVAAVQVYLVIYAVNVLLVDTAIWGYVMLALPVTMIVLSIPIGKFVDKINRKVPILAAYAFFFVSLLLFANGWNILFVFLSLMFLGVGLVMMNAGSNALQADLTPRESRGKVQGFSSFVNFIVMALGAATGGFLYEHLSPAAPFYVSMIVAIPAFLLTLAMVHEPKKRQE
jgi:DHA1 family multidrug resistance protein B-like MFS transporter